RALARRLRTGHAPRVAVKILLLQLRRIGDLVCTTPAIAALRAHFPEAHITLAVARENEPLLPAIRDIDEFVITRRGLRDLAAWVKLRPGRFDLAIDFTRNDRSAWLTFLSHAPIRITSIELPHNFRRHAYTRFAPGSLLDLHTIDFHLALLSPIGIVPASAAPILALPDAARESASAIIRSKLADQPFAIFHPGAARVERFWEPARWAEVIEFAARDLGLRPVLTGISSAMEQDHLAAIRSHLRTDVLDLSGQIDLLTLAALIERARLLVTLDTGPMHLATALRTPQVNLFGPGNPLHWRPRGSPAVILYGENEKPLEEFVPRAPRLPMSLISTRAVIGGMKTLLATPRGAPL
ncbi:MAG: glycosyltransferase family 9 protein, partial [Chthoniobacterales bacterium]